MDVLSCHVGPCRVADRSANGAIMLLCLTDKGPHKQRVAPLVFIRSQMRTLKWILREAGSIMCCRKSSQERHLDRTLLCICKGLALNSESWNNQGDPPDQWYRTFAMETLAHSSKAEVQVLGGYGSKQWD